MLVCPACFLEFRTAVRFCSRCGAALVVRPQAPSLSKVYPIPFVASPHLEGISGWLLLVAISLAITPYYVVRNAVRIDVPLLIDHGTLGAALVGSLFLLKNAVTLSFLTVLNWLFYRKKSVFPVAMIAFHVYVLIVHILEHIAHAALSPHSASPLISAPVLFSLISCVLWIPYLLLSRRVKATFVR